METMKLRRSLVLCLAAILLAGCKGRDEVAPAPKPSERTASEVSTQPKQRAAAKVVAGKLVVPNAAGVMETMAGVFYFDYNQAIVKRQGHAELKKHAKALANNRRYRLRIEGHSDERGSREYNLALGERRADAVRAYLIAQGARGSQVEVVSYGEEKPVDPGRGESAWTKNRRVRVIYR